MLTLRQLNYIDALSRHLHFGNAARECAISQPALSVQIRELEKHLDIQLFERSQSGVLLTKHGEEIVERARLILANVAGIKEYANTQNGFAANLRIGIIATIAPYILPQFLENYSVRFQAAQPIIRESRTEQLLEELRSGKVDLVIGALPLGDAEFSTIKLAKDKFVLAMPPQAELPVQGDSLGGLIARENLLLLEEGHCLRDQTLSHCDAAGVQLGKIYGTSNLSTLVQMVTAGIGVTLLPELSLSVERRGLNFQIVEFPDPAPFRNIGMAWRKSSPGADAYLEIGEIIRNICLGSPPN